MSLCFICWIWYVGCFSSSFGRCWTFGLWCLSFWRSWFKSHWRHLLVGYFNGIFSTSLSTKRNTFHAWCDVSAILPIFRDPTSFRLLLLFALVKWTDFSIHGKIISLLLQTFTIRKIFARREQNLSLLRINRRPILRQEYFSSIYILPSNLVLIIPMMNVNIEVSVCDWNTLELISWKLIIMHIIINLIVNTVTLSIMITNWIIEFYLIPYYHWMDCFSDICWSLMRKYLFLLWRSLPIPRSPIQIGRWVIVLWCNLRSFKTRLSLIVWVNILLIVLVLLLKSFRFFSPYIQVVLL